MTESVGDIVHEVAASSPSTTALVCDDRTWTFAELASQIDRMTAALRATTVAGDRVAVLSENDPQFVVAYYAVPRAGLSLVHLNYRLHPSELRWQIAHSGASVVLGQERYLAALGPIEGVSTAVLDHFGSDAFRTKSISSDPAWIIYTSGTTGRPKGAMLSNENLLAAVATSVVGRPVAQDEVYLFPFPLCHVSGYNVLLHHASGRPVVLLRRFDAAELFAVVRRWGVTAMSLAPTMISMLLADEGMARADFATLRTIGYGASPIAPAVLERATAAFGCGFNQGYGMTELSGNVAFLSPDDHRRALDGASHLLTAAGRPGPNVEIAIAHDGEILVRAPQVTMGYLGDPSATAAAITDGWLHTGDAGRIDDDGYLYVIDRLKDIIVTGGENVASREVEDAIAEHPAVLEVAVIGVPDEMWGERVTAFVTVVSNTGVRSEDVIAFARTRLAGYKTPKDVHIVAVLPTSATGKISKGSLREQVGRPSASKPVTGL